MNKKKVEGIEKVIKEYLKKNLRIEPRVRYLDAYSSTENYLDIYLGDEKIQEVKLLESDFRDFFRDFMNSILEYE